MNSEKFLNENNASKLNYNKHCFRTVNIPSSSTAVINLKYLF